MYHPCSTLPFVLPEDHGPPTVLWTLHHSSCTSKALIRGFQAFMTAAHLLSSTMRPVPLRVRPSFIMTDNDDSIINAMSFVCNKGKM